MAVCMASAALEPLVCPGWQPCNPNAIAVGDAVDIAICIENNSIINGRDGTTAAAAVLRRDAQLRVLLACEDGACTSQIPDVLARATEVARAWPTRATRSATRRSAVLVPANARSSLCSCSTSSSSCSSLSYSQTPLGRKGKKSRLALARLVSTCTVREPGVNVTQLK